MIDILDFLLNTGVSQVSEDFELADLTSGC